MTEIETTPQAFGVTFAERQYESLEPKPESVSGLLATQARHLWFFALGLETQKLATVHSWDAKQMAEFSHTAIVRDLELRQPKENPTRNEDVDDLSSPS